MKLKVVFTSSFMFSIVLYSCNNASVKTDEAIFAKPVLNSSKPKIPKYKMHPEYSHELRNSTQFIVVKADRYGGKVIKNIGY